MSNINYFDIKPTNRTSNRLISVIKDKSKKLISGTTIIEVGTHSGFMTDMFSRIVGINGRVISFEPNFYYFAHFMNKYQFKDNVTVYPFALSDKLELIQVAHSSILPEGDTLFKEIYFHKETTTYPIDIRIDNIGVPLDLISEQLNLKSLDFIKMNCEGYEINVLLGSVNTLKKYKPDILIISHELEDGTNTKYKCKEILDDLGYSTEFLEERPAYLLATYEK